MEFSLTMNSCKRVLIIFAISSFCLFLRLPSHAEAEDPLKLVTSACKQVGDFNSCADVLKTLPLAPDLQGMALSALDVAKTETTNMRDFFNDISNKEPAFKDALKECANQFNTSINLFHPMVLEGGMGSLDVHYALDNIKICEDGLSKSNVHIDSVTSKLQAWKPYFTAAYATVMAIENTNK